MAPTIHCVRHAQGFHNLGREFHSVQDPQLTPLGHEQCDILRKTSFADQTQISLVTASPLSRTLHTAYLTFKPALANGKCLPQILAIPDTQETSDFPCDTGSDVPVLESIVAERNWPVDLSLLKPDWNVKTLANRYSPHSDAIKARATAARQFLRQKVQELVDNGDDDAQVVLVTHGGYLHYFTDDWEEPTKQNGTGWQNCETRSYTFEQGFAADDEEARLVETMDSRRRRGKDYPMYGSDQQIGLFQKAMQGWEDQGLQRPDRLGTATWIKPLADEDVDAALQDQAVKSLNAPRRMSEVRAVA